MKKIFILGAGCWGSTLATIYAKKGLEVNLWEPIEENLKFLTVHRRPKFFKYITLPKQVNITSNIAEIQNSDIVLLVTPSAYVYDTLLKLKPLNNNLQNKIFISCVKGFEQKTLKTFSQMICETLSVNKQQVFVLSGPSHAEEVAMGKPTAVVLAGINKQLLETLQKLLSTEVLRTYINTDVIGVEIAAAVKNIYAIAAGICDGLNLGSNAKAALLTRSIKEMVIIGKCYNAQQNTFFGLAGIGDLLTTAYSNFSRNYTFGKYLAVYKDVEKAKVKIKTTIEGYFACKAVHFIAQKNNLDLPIAEEVYKIIYKRKPPELAINTLLSRPLKEEFCWLQK